MADRTKVYKTGHGLPFYSEWAFGSFDDVAFKANMSALMEYKGRYCMPKFKQSVEDCIEENPDKLVYRYGTMSIGRQSYTVCANPENLSVEEIALIVDGGNLCFGFSASANTIDIYTD